MNTSVPSIRPPEVDHDPFAGPALSRVVPSTEEQREVWLASRMSVEASLAYNEAIRISLDGELDLRRVETAIDALWARHEALRSTFSDDGTELFVAEPEPVGLDRHDLSGLPADEAEATAHRIHARAVSEPFDLALGPLARAVLIRFSPERHELVVTAHHAVCDGWSFGVLVEEFVALYGDSDGTSLQPAPRFGDYAAAQRSDAARSQASEHARWWVRQLEAIPPAFDLPLDRPRMPERSYASVREDLLVPSSLIEAVRACGARHGASLFSTLFTVFHAVIARLSAQGDLAIGVPVAGQSIEGTPTLVGHCVRLLPIRQSIAMDAVAAEHLAATSTRVMDAYERASATLGSILQDVTVDRTPNRPPLVPVIFNLDAEFPERVLEPARVKVAVETIPRGFENFELFLNIAPRPEGVRFECQYSTALFDRDSIRRWLELFRTALARLVEDPSRTMGELVTATGLDLAMIERFNDSRLEHDRTSTVHRLIVAQASERPDHVAIRCAGQSFSYRWLLDRSGRLAEALTRRGIGPGDRVGLQAGRNQHMIAGLLGILRTGAAYVPLDPSFPANRLEHMISDAGVDVIVSDSSICDIAGTRSTVRIDVDQLSDEGDALDHDRGAPDDVAYVIYTSGSTGTPKGVCLPHRAVVNLLRSVAREPGMNDANVVLAVTTLSFDIAVSEVILPLTVGATIVVADREQAVDGARLGSLIESERVDFVDATPATWRLLLDAGWQGSPRMTAICTGEPLPPDLGARLLPKVHTLWNGYGPTETTVWSTFHRVEHIDGPVPIGRPVANTCIHVVDERLATVPVGVVGEIFISGEGVALGYLNRDELTRERFVAAPTGPTGTRWYRTGDLGRWRADGVLECLGRTDHQVKVRGYRIELGEIEATLATHPGVARAVVVAREDSPGDVRLVAYVVHDEASASSDALRAHLRSLLPDYMIPARFVTLDAIPQLPNGKIDRAALPRPDDVATPAPLDRPAAISPRSSLERTIASAMERALKLPGLGLHDDFFMMGGHSLLAARLAGDLSSELGRPVPIHLLFKAPTVAALAAALGDPSVRPSDADARIDPIDDDASAPLSPIQQRLWFIEALQPGRTVFNTPSAHRLRGPLDEHAFQTAFDSILRGQDVLRTAIVESAAGPVQILGPVPTCPLFPSESLEHLSSADRETALRERLEALAARPIGLDAPPYFVARMFRLAPEEHVLFFMAHHIIWDGWSFDLLYREMDTAYRAALHGTASPTRRERPTFRAFAAWQQAWLKSSAATAQVDFWTRRLAGHRGTLDLPTDRPRPARMSGRGGAIPVRLDPDLTRAARVLARSLDTTLFTVLLAGYFALLHRMSGDSDLVVGTPFRGRELPATDEVMGCFVNALPLRIQVDAEAPFVSLVNQVSTALREALVHPDLPFERLVQSLSVPRDESRPAVYQAFFSFQDVRDRPSAWGPLKHEQVFVMQPDVADDLGLWFLESESGLAGGLSYNAEVFERVTAERIGERYAHLLGHVTRWGATSVARIPLLPQAEATRIRAYGTGRSRPLPVPATMHGAADDRLRSLGARAALVSGGRSISYVELDRRIEAIERTLIRAGASKGHRIGLCIERTADMIASLMAVLRVGATYVPLDPSFPRDRLAFMCKDVGLDLLVTTAPLRQVLDLRAPACVQLESGTSEDEDTPRGTTAREAPDPEAPAYIIYTSGSTGRPKGVAIPHRAVANFIGSMIAEPGFGESDRLLAVTTLSFDIAVLELMLPLSVGGTVVLANAEEARDGIRLASLIAEHDVNVMQATPSTWRLLRESGWAPTRPMRALVGGESLPADLAAWLLASGCEVWNMYGPTETTVWSTTWRVRNVANGITIGEPIANTRVRILGPSGEDCPHGVPGEIHIGGAGLALGYHERPDLNAERFVDDPLGGPGRLYRTGDLGRWRHDGLIEHLGRMDQQLKVRGHRIEPGEIEATLLDDPSIARAVVVAREDVPGDVRLVAYFTASGSSPHDAAALRARLQRTLPDYMIPQHLVSLSAIPLLPNGKVNRSALPPPGAELARPTTSSRRAPSTETERALAEVWSQLLGFAPRDVEDNFFDLGGHSLLAMQALSAMEARCGKRVEPRQYLFDTLEQIARSYDATPVRTSERPGLLRKIGALFRSGQS